MKISGFKVQYVHRSMHICTPYIKEHSIHISPPNSNFALNIYTYVSSSKLTLPLSTQNAMTSNDMPCHVSLLCTYPPPPTLLSFPLPTYPPSNSLIYAFSSQHPPLQCKHLLCKFISFTNSTSIHFTVVTKKNSPLIQGDKILFLRK